MMRIRKPPSVYAKSLLFRPNRALHGNFSIGLSLETTAIRNVGASASAAIEWCGSRRQLVFGASMAGFVTNLRLPRNLTEGDIYVLTVSGPGMLILSVDILGDEGAADNIEIEELDDAPVTKTICADPTTLAERQFEDALAAGGQINPTPRAAALGRIESLRPFPESGVLNLTFRRTAGTGTASVLLIKATVGEMRNTGFIPAGQMEANIYFRLRAEEAGETWPLTLTCDQAFTWSGAVRRNFDTNFLPAFSLVV